MQFPRNLAVDSFVTSPSSVIRLGVNRMYASGVSICGELHELKMPRSWCCAIAVPIAPGDVPMTADGLRANEFLPCGRLAQSILTNNCEHLCAWALRDECRSWQVDRIHSAPRATWHALCTIVAHLRLPRIQRPVFI